MNACVTIGGNCSRTPMVADNTLGRRALKTTDYLCIALCEECHGQFIWIVDSMDPKFSPILT